MPTITEGKDRGALIAYIDFRNDVVGLSQRYLDRLDARVQIHTLQSVAQEMAACVCLPDGSEAALVAVKRGWWARVIGLLSPAERTP